jgi:hypothetical protein
VAVPLSANSTIKCCYAKTSKKVKDYYAKGRKGSKTTKKTTTQKGKATTTKKAGRNKKTYGYDDYGYAQLDGPTGYDNRYVQLDGPTGYEYEHELLSPARARTGYEYEHELKRPSDVMSWDFMKDLKPPPKLTAIQRRHHERLKSIYDAQGRARYNEFNSANMERFNSQVPTWLNKLETNTGVFYQIIKRLSDVAKTFAGAPLALVSFVLSFFVELYLTLMEFIQRSYMFSGALGDIAQACLVFIPVILCITALNSFVDYIEPWAERVVPFWTMTRNAVKTMYTFVSVITGIIKMVFRVLVPFFSVGNTYLKGGGDPRLRTFLIAMLSKFKRTPYLALNRMNKSKLSPEQSKVTEKLFATSLKATRISMAFILQTFGKEISL